MIGVGLISLFSPPSNIGPFASICGRFSKSAQRQIALRVFFFYCVAGLLCIWMGHWFFLLLGLKASSVMATGGLVVFFTVALSAPLSSKMTEGHRDILTRLSGIVLSALFFQLLVRGLTEPTLSYVLGFLNSQPLP